MKNNIYTFVPYDSDRHLERSYNKFMSMLPDGSWGCFIDHDAMFTTTDWYLQLHDIIEEHPEYSCFTVMTNRIYNSKQVVTGIDSNNHDISYHRQLGNSLRTRSYRDVEDITDDEVLFSGVVILYKKEAWKSVPFRQWPGQTLYGVDYALHQDLRAKGYKIGLMEGVYVYHWYRATIKYSNLDKSNNEPNVLIAMPLPKSYKVDFDTMKFCASSLRSGWHWLNCVSVEPTVARNMMISIFLKKPEYARYTHLFFVDSDTIPPPGTIDRLLAHDKDVVVGLTPLWGGGCPCWNAQLVGTHKHIPGGELPKELFEIDRVGGTTILVKRGVLEKIKYPYFKVIMPKSPTKAVKFGPIFQGSDFYFCDNVKSAGFEIWADPTILCKHMKQVDLLTLIKE